MDKIFDKFNDDEEQMHFGEDMRKYELYVIVPYIIPILFFFIVSSVLSAIGGILGMIGGPFGLIGTVIPLFIFLCEAFLAVGAWKGYAIRIPVLGNIINVFK